MNKVLNIITNGINSNGIASSWLAVCEELKHSNLSSEVTMTFTYDVENCNKKIVRNFEELGFKTISTPSRLKNPLKYIFYLINVLKRGEYNIVHVNGSSSLMLIELIAGYLAGVKLRIAHSRNTTCLNLKIHKLLTIPFIKLANGRLACGSDAGKWLFGNNSFTVLHNGKDFSKYSFSESLRCTERKNLGVDNQIVIGHVGRFNEQKNQSFLIDIFKAVTERIDNVTLLLIGDGKLMDMVKMKVDRLGLTDKVIFTGAITDVYNKLQAADIMIFPSLYEGLPNVVLEWQAMGLPCLISDTITKECAVSNLVHFESITERPAKWANKALSLLAKSMNRIENAKIAKDNLIKARFDIKDTTKDLIDFYINNLHEKLK